MTLESGVASSAGWPRVSVVIPTLNEARNLPHVFAQLPAGLHEVIVVDGHSVDGTLAVARSLRPDVRIVLQTRKGKGNALACGFAAATGDIIAMVDADGSADPGEIPRFVQALTAGSDFAKGTRYAAGGGSSDLTRIRSLGNRVLSGTVNLCYRTKYSDLCYGYNVFWRRVLPVLDLDATSAPRADGVPLWGDGFEVETLINIRIARARLTVTEVPSFEHSRIHGLSNLNAVRDGLRVLRTIVSESRRPRHRSAQPAAPDARLAPLAVSPGKHESAVCAPGGHELPLLGTLHKAGATGPHPPSWRKVRGPGRPSEPAVGPTPLL
jgi:glycosyltransferase involved in cell wall biosynthesis